MGEKELSKVVEEFVSKKCNGFYTAELRVSNVGFDIVGYCKKEKCFWVVEVKSANTPVDIGKTFGQIVTYQSILYEMGYKLVQKFSERIQQKGKCLEPDELNDIFASKRMWCKFFIALPHETFKNYGKLVERLKRSFERQIGMITISQEDKVVRFDEAEAVEIDVSQELEWIDFLSRVIEETKKRISKLMQNLRPRKPSNWYQQLSTRWPYLHFEIQILRREHLIAMALDFEPPPNQKKRKNMFFEFLQSRKNEIERQLKTKVILCKDWLNKGLWGRIHIERKYSELDVSLVVEISKNFAEFIKVLLPYLEQFFESK